MAGLTVIYSNGCRRDKPGFVVAVGYIVGNCVDR